MPYGAIPNRMLFQVWSEVKRSGIFSKQTPDPTRSFSIGPQTSLINYAMLFKSLVREGVHWFCHLARRAISDDYL